MKQDMILILDLGSDKNTQIAREIRALGVYTEIHAHDLSAAELAALPNVKGILLNGGPNRIVNGAAIDASRRYTPLAARFLPPITRARRRFRRTRPLVKRGCLSLCSERAGQNQTGIWSILSMTR